MTWADDLVRQWEIEYPEDAQRHKQLNRSVIQRPADYMPWGDVPAVSRGPDCSCGCRWFIPLEGVAGADWGVCTNLVSDRCGLLTFEHQGCVYFEMEEDRS